MWYYLQGDAQIGPVEAEQIRELVMQGDIAPDTLVWQEGMPDWIEADKTEFAGFFRYAPQRSAAASSSTPQVTQTPSGRSFSMKEALSFGWNTMKSNLGFFILLFIVYGLLFVIPDVIAREVSKTDPSAGAVLHIVDILLSMLMGIGLIKISLDFCDHQPGRISDLFSQYRLLWKVILATIVYVLIVWVGVLLLIIPGIIWSIKFFFYDYLIIDENQGVMESLETSSLITRGAKWDLFVFSLLLGLINLAGAMLFIVGLFVTMPITMVAFAHAYRQLRCRGNARTIAMPS